MLHVISANASADAGREESSGDACIPSCVDNADGLLCIARKCKGCGIPREDVGRGTILSPKVDRDHNVLVFH